MFHYFSKLYNQMKQMTSVIFSKNICVLQVTKIVYTGRAIYIVGCITIRDITIGVAWWVSYTGQKSL